MIFVLSTVHFDNDVFCFINFICLKRLQLVTYIASHCSDICRMATARQQPAYLTSTFIVCTYFCVRACVRACVRVCVHILLTVIPFHNFFSLYQWSSDRILNSCFSITFRAGAKKIHDIKKRSVLKFNANTFVPTKGMKLFQQTNQSSHPSIS